LRHQLRIDKDQSNVLVLRQRREKESGMKKRERMVLAVCMTVLMSIAFGISLNNIGIGIAIGICMGVAFGVFGEGEDSNE